MSLHQDELIDLYDFIDVMSNTQVPSVQGYLLRDGLKKHMNRTSSEPASIEPFLYKYHYHSRILDEAHLSILLSAIQNNLQDRFLILFAQKFTILFFEKYKSLI